MSARENYIRNLYGGSSSSSSSGSSTGTSGGAVGGYTPSSGGGSSNIGTSGVGTNVSNIQGPIIDPKLDEDAGVYEANQNLFDDIKNSYTSPQDTYASDLNFIGIDPETIEDLGLLEKFANNEFTLSDEVLKFYGVDPANPGYIPKELYQMIAEGSIVTPMEAMKSGESGIGSFTDLEMGNHPLLGGIDKYYGIMSGSAFPGAAAGGDGGGRINVGGGGDYGSYLGAGLGRRPKQLGDSENIPAHLRMLQYMVNVHKGNPYTKLAMRKKDGGLATLVGD